MKEQQNRCFWSKISEYHLDLWMRLNSVQMRTLTGSRWTSKNYIIRCHRWLGSVNSSSSCSWGQDARVRASGRLRALGPQWPTVEQPSQNASAAMVRRTLGQYVAVCPRLQLTSHTQPTSTLSRIKCERYIFIKKCVCSFIEVRHYFLLCFRLYMYVYCIVECGYTTF